MQCCTCCLRIRFFSLFVVSMFPLSFPSVLVRWSCWSSGSVCFWFLLCFVLVCRVLLLFLCFSFCLGVPPCHSCNYGLPAPSSYRPCLGPPRRNRRGRFHVGHSCSAAARRVRTPGTPSSRQPSGAPPSGAPLWGRPFWSTSVWCTPFWGISLYSALLVHPLPGHTSGAPPSGVRL